MKFSILFNKLTLGCLAFFALTFSACKKDGNPNNLPGVSPSDYEGKIEGYTSSNEIFPDNLVAYWNFDNDEKETVTGTAPTSSSNDEIVDGGVMGKALSLDSGFVYFANQFPAFKTNVFKSFTISLWTKILNNGSKRTMIFQLARPGLFNGNINFALNTNSNPASNTDVLKIQPTFTTVGGGTQDNLNNALSPKIGMGKWTNIVLTYDGSSGVFNIWADGLKIGGYPNRGVGNNLFKSYEPNEVTIGSNYNGIPGKEVDANTSFDRMTGQIDEIRVYNIALPEAHIKALFKLGGAGK
jgi:hypothetical protein